jgi:hypothetical protein
MPHNLFSSSGRQDAYESKPDENTNNNPTFIKLSCPPSFYPASAFSVSLAVPKA